MMVYNQEYIARLQKNLVEKLETCPFGKSF